jgi:hypothetical protein
VNSTPAYSLPFGKHRGLPLARVPTDYLTWLVAQAWPDEYVKNQVAFELARRASEQDAAAVASGGLPAVVGAEMARAIVQAGRRVLMEQYAGDPAYLLALDATADMLETWALEVFRDKDQEVSI